MLIHFLPLWAVHISDGVLYWPVWLGGYGLLVIFLGLGLRSLRVGNPHSREEPITWTALLTAAFFVATLIHVSLGPTSVHLLLNGLVGLVLGRRACLAIPIGVALQAFLLGHGGLQMIGVNSCTMLIPALLARPLYHYCVHSLLAGAKEMALALLCLFFPGALALVPAVVVITRLAARGLNLGIIFVSGFLVGCSAVVLTALLTGIVLARGGEEDWTAVALLLMAAHLPLALIEGVIVGFTCSFLAKVRPQLLPGYEPPTYAPPLRTGEREQEARCVIPAEESPPMALPTDLSPR
ncbi:MAG TPA: CbiM family transporter [Gemmataceae bacterium]|nr:CbiM family transporter [Gemmataceae bacterium]